MIIWELLLMLQASAPLDLQNLISLLYGLSAPFLFAVNAQECATQLLQPQHRIALPVQVPQTPPPGALPYSDSSSHVLLVSPCSARVCGKKALIVSEWRCLPL